MEQLTAHAHYEIVGNAWSEDKYIHLQCFYSDEYPVADFTPRLVPQARRAFVPLDLFHSVARSTVLAMNFELRCDAVGDTKFPGL